MQFSNEAISGMLALQKADFELLQAKKKFDELPQRQAILDARQKKAAILKKQDQVAAMRADVDAKIEKVIKEDEDLAKKQQEVQEAIVAAGSDYRNLESRTKELEGHAKRRAVLADQLADLDTQQQKVAAVQEQVVGMLSQVQSVEDKHIASFQEQGGALQREIAQLKAKREALLGALDSQAAAEYEKTAAACGGVAIGVMNGASCGICRTPFDDTRLVNIRSQAPVSRCPHCKRMLVIL